jgi:hypothetical protein
VRSCCGKIKIKEVRMGKNKMYTGFEAAKMRPITRGFKWPTASEV